MRAAARGLDGDVNVEKTPDGLLLKLTGDGGEARIRLAVSQAGIRDLGIVASGAAPPGTPGRAGAVRDHLRALERSGTSDLDALVSEFEQSRFSERFLAETSREERRALLNKIRSAAASAGAVMLSEEGELAKLMLRGPESTTIVLKVTSGAPFTIDMLRTEAIEAGIPKLDLSWKNAARTFRDLEKEGFSGVVHLARDGKTVLHDTYGKSNRGLKLKTRIDTVYGIGSTPIDFTVAGLFLLAQQGKLDLDDALPKFFESVPGDKQGMTLRHLISGQSGLPDFHDMPGDWDADLAWIDRETAVRRILAQPLIFAPGTSRAHSHSAYGLAAAVIERISGKDYFSFMKTHFFDPAGMTRTGMNGSSGGFPLEDFAEGYGNSAVGLPNIPPNWGPTSWLVMGSGGMYSTLDDMLKFYRYVRDGKVLEPEYAERYQGETVGIGGSDRGFYFFHARGPDGREALMLMNGEGRAPEIRSLSQALETLVLGQ